MAAILIACSGGGNHDGGSVAPTAKATDSNVGPDTAWPALMAPSQPPDQSLVRQLHQCNQADQRTCAVQVMQQAGASQNAIDFYTSTGWFLTDLKPYGPLALGTIVNPWRANANSQYAVLNGSPDVVYIEQEGAKLDLASDPTFAALQSAFPAAANQNGMENLLVFEADNQFEGVMQAPDDNTQRFVFRYNVVNVCHACGTGYWERAGLDFDAKGVYKSVIRLGLCHMPSTPVSLPGVDDCPPSVR